MERNYDGEIRFENVERKVERKYDEELENTLRTIRAEAFIEFKELD